MNNIELEQRIEKENQLRLELATAIINCETEKTKQLWEQYKSERYEIKTERKISATYQPVLV